MNTTEWKRLPFLEAFADKTAAGHKVPQKYFANSGKVPIIDQGQEYIAGYSDDESLAWNRELPVVVFGDHTRAIKYVDVPFILGADGIKVLVPIEGLSAKFAYYVLRNAEIPSAGYSRHFRFLRDIEVAYPPLPEQKRIVRILDEAEELRRLRSEADRRTADLIPAIFYDMFGDPRTNLLRLPVASLGDTVKFTTGKLDSNAAEENGLYPFFTCSRQDFRINTYAFDCEALLLSGNNATADYSVKYYSGKFNAYQRTYVITLLNPDHSYLYVKHALELQLNDMKRLSRGTNTKYLTLSILKNLPVLLPSVELQRTFATRVAEVRAMEAEQAQSRRRLDDLFQSLLHQAFGCGVS